MVFDRVQICNRVYAGIRPLISWDPGNIRVGTERKFRWNPGNIQLHIYEWRSRDGSAVKLSLDRVRLRSLCTSRSIARATVCTRSMTCGPKNPARGSFGCPICQCLARSRCTWDRNPVSASLRCAMSRATLSYVSTVYTYNELLKHGAILILQITATIARSIDRSEASREDVGVQGLDRVGN